MPKIVLIGAGSVVFAKTLLADILSFPALQQSTLSLVDINADRLRPLLGQDPFPDGEARFLSVFIDQASL